MSVQPEGEDVRKAVKWISEERKYDPDKKLTKLMDEAGMKFNLSPADMVFVRRYVTGPEKQD